MGKKKGKVALSFPKLEAVITKADYRVEKLYVENGSIAFMLCKSPKFQKTFVVHIPNKFNLPIPKRTDLEVVEIIQTPAAESVLSKRQIFYLEDIASEGVSSIICISNSTLTSCTPKGVEHYVVPSEVDGESDSSEDGDGDEIDTLEKNTKKLEKAINKLKSNSGEKKSKKHSDVKKSESKNSDAKKSESKKSETKKSDEKGKASEKESENEDTEEGEEEKSEGGSEGEVEQSEEERGESEEAEQSEDGVESEAEGEGDRSEEESETEGKIELVFDEDDEVDDEILDDEEVEESEDDSSIESTGETGDNSFPQDMLERDIVIGVIYVLIDISPFLKSIADYEDVLVTQYAQIDVNEFELRKTRLSRIKTCFDSVYEKVGEIIEKKKEEEKKIKTKIVRSTILLLQIQVLKDKIKTNPSKYSDISSDVQETYDQTIKTISNMNLDVMELRDEVDEMLTNFSTIIKDLNGITK